MLEVKQWIVVSERATLTFIRQLMAEGYLESSSSKPLSPKSNRQSQTTIWSTGMKKRNKKYNPKQIVKQKVHKFQMTWEVNEAKRIIEMHHLLGGVDPQESTHTPLEV